MKDVTSDRRVPRPLAPARLGEDRSDRSGAGRLGRACQCDGAADRLPRLQLVIPGRQHSRQAAHVPADDLWLPDVCAEMYAGGTRGLPRVRAGVAASCATRWRHTSLAAAARRTARGPFENLSIPRPQARQLKLLLGSKVVVQPNPDEDRSRSCHSPIRARERRPPAQAPFRPPDASNTGLAIRHRLRAQPQRSRNVFDASTRQKVLQDVEFTARQAGVRRVRQIAWTDPGRDIGRYHPFAAGGPANPLDQHFGRAALGDEADRTGAHALSKHRSTVVHGEDQDSDFGSAPRKPQQQVGAAASRHR